MPRYLVVHNTTYEYATAAEACHNIVHLDPRNAPGQTCSGTTVQIEPVPLKTHTHLDYFGNRVRSFAVLGPHEKLSITSESQVVVDRQAPELGGSPEWEEIPARIRKQRNDSSLEALECVFDSPYVRTGAALRAYAAPSFSPRRPLLIAMNDLTNRIHKEFVYDPTATTIDTSVDVVLKRRRGVCQDFAHLQIGCLRSLGLPARYVSGYLRTHGTPGQPRLTGADASHAWVSLYCPGKGWVDFDPTNGCVVGSEHIVLAWGRDFHDVSPVKGIMLGAHGSSLSVAVDVSLQ